MDGLNPELQTFSLPWATENQLSQMIVYPEHTHLKDLEWPHPAKDLALVNKHDECVGWIPFVTLTNAIHGLWQTTTHFYETLLEAVDDAVTVIDQKGHIISWNSSAEALYERPKEQVLGRPITDFFKREALMLMTTLHHGTSVKHQYNQSRSDIHVLVNTTPLTIGGEIWGGLSVERNINDLIKLNEGLADKTAYIQDLEQKIDTMNAQDPFHKIKGQSRSLRDSIKLAKKVASTDAPVLISGESGVGKELFAQAIHKSSPRADQPFIDLNCGAIPASLFESELFGYEKGAFTGAAKEGKKGKFDLAKEGTLFLDEIGELPLNLQVKLLRVLQEKTFYRVGGTRPIPVDVRILSATNRNLGEMVENGDFRQDLYYRLNVVSIPIPPLRDRLDDLPELFQLFITEFAQKYRKPIPKLDPEVMVRFLNHSWSGNIRQLRNTIEHMIILSDGEGLQAQHLPQGLTAAMPHRRSTAPYTFSKPPGPGNEEKDATDLTLIQNALDVTYGNKSAAAKLLGISRVTLYNRLKKYGLK